MWTNTGGWTDRSKEFEVNYFVPLLQKGHDKHADGDWKFVPYKRKGTNIKWNSAKCLKKEGKNVRLSDINNKGESSVQAERKYSAASQDGTKLSMPNDENSKKNSIEELKRMQIGVNTPQNNKLTHKEQRR